MYFEVITTVAIVVGITLANVFKPGTGIDMSTLATVDISKYEATTAQVQEGTHSLVATILSLIPQNIFAAMAKGEMLPIIFFSVLFGLGLSALPSEQRDPLVNLFRGVSETMFKVTHMIMRYAPVGVFALIAVTIANFGFASLWPREAGVAGLCRYPVLCVCGAGGGSTLLQTAHYYADAHFKRRADPVLLDLQF